MTIPTPAHLQEQLAAATLAMNLLLLAGSLLVWLRLVELDAQIAELPLPPL